MKNIVIKSLSASLICLMSIGVANAAPQHQKAKATKATKTEKVSNETRLQINACNKKQQGEWTKYSYQGVTFNGTCEQNENGKLQFKSPTPAGGSTAAAESAAPAADSAAPAAIDSAAPADESNAAPADDSATPAS